LVQEKRKAISHLRKLQKLPGRIKRYFRHPKILMQRRLFNCRMNTSVHLKRETPIWGIEKLMRLFVDEYHFRPMGDVITLKQESLVQLN